MSPFKGQGANQAPRAGRRRHRTASSTPPLCEQALLDGIALARALRSHELRGVVRRCGRASGGSHSGHAHVSSDARRFPCSRQTCSSGRAAKCVRRATRRSCCTRPRRWQSRIRRARGRRGTSGSSNPLQQQERGGGRYSLIAFGPPATRLHSCDDRRSGGAQLRSRKHKKKERRCERGGKQTQETTQAARGTAGKPPERSSSAPREGGMGGRRGRRTAR